MEDYLQTLNTVAASKINRSGFRENKTARRAALVVISRANRRIRQIESARMSNSTVLPNRKFCVAKVFNVDRKARENEDMIRGLPSIMRPEILMTLQEEDKELYEMKQALEERDFDRFKKAGKAYQQFYHVSYVNPTGILIVDNRLAVPSSLRSAVLQWLHKGHPGQRAMIDAASYLWWPKMHTNIIETAEKCEPCAENLVRTLKHLLARQGMKI